jgi:hypothetical protein
MAVYFSEGSRFSVHKLHKLGEDGAGTILHGREPLSKKLGPGCYFDLDSDYKRNWKTKTSKREPMSYGHRKSNPDVAEFNAKLPPWIVLPGANYQKKPSPGPGHYDPYNDRERLSSRSGKRSKNHGNRNNLRPSSAAAAASVGRFPRGIIHKGAYFEANFLPGIGSPSVPGPGTYDVDMEHFALMVSHNVRRLSNDRDTIRSPITRPNSRNESFRPVSQKYRIQDGKNGRDNSSVALDMYLGVDAGSTVDSHSTTVSLSASEQLALVS